MKKAVITLMTVFLWLLWSLPVFAQTEPISGRIVTDIPFEFVVGGQVMPPGNYVIESTGMHDSWLVMNLADRSCRTFVTVTDLDANDANANTRLVFRNAGEKRILYEVWAKGTDHGHRLIPEAARK